jgi:hypothetical protein
MKNYKLCKSTTGYMWNFTVYTGKDTTYGQRCPGEQTPLRIVLELAHDLLDKSYCLHLDNWYTSPKLDDNFCTRKTDVVGTIRANKNEFPDFMKRAKLQQGETVAAFHKKQMTISGGTKEMSHQHIS